MAYSTTNPPRLLSVAPLTGAGQMWQYLATDVGTAVDAAGFITNGLDLGMRALDIVLVHGSTTGLVTSHIVSAVTSTGADLSDGTVFTSTSNSD